MHQHEYAITSSKADDKISALSKHARRNRHNFSERNHTKLLINEVNQIIKHNETACNDKTDVKSCSDSYCSLIDRYNR